MEKHIENLITKARNEFEQILTSVTQKTEGQSLHQVERNIFCALLRLGLMVLTLYIEQFMKGRADKKHIDPDGVMRPYHCIKKREYQSVFGKISIERACYWEKGKTTLCPLDAQLNLPENEYSYLLQEWSMSLGVSESYQKVTTFLQNMLGINLWSEPLETICQNASREVERFYKDLEAPDPVKEGELLVVTADGKGVPMKQEPKKDKKRRRLKKGEKLGKKKMSTVTAVYTIGRNPRTADQVMGENTLEQKRPLPQNKIVKATLSGKDKAFEDLVEQVEQRDAQREKTCVALLDGEHKLRALIQQYLPFFKIILDFFHVTEYLWLAAHVFFKEGSQEAEDWAVKLTKGMLEGRVTDIILYLRGCLKYRALSNCGQKQLSRVIKYLENGQEYMRYDEYLVQGYPIGSGVIEGACKNLVKDRMELSGMRWSLNGAEAMLKLRSIHINGLAKEYWTFWAEQERKRLYGERVSNEEGLAA